MKDIKIAKTAGFCFGVKRAVNTVYEQIENGQEGPVYTYGPIIHNESVVRDLEGKGVIVLSESQIDTLLTKHEFDGGKDQSSKARMIIRSHGVGRSVYDCLEECGFEVIDATCPFVKKIHRIVEEESKKGHTIMIVGDATHPEVLGIRDWCEGQSFIVNSIEDIGKIEEKLPKDLYIVSQTTFNGVKFQDIVEFLRKRGYNVFVYNTICNATEERQREARELAADVDTMIVIGGKNSSNTQKLYEICRKECEQTYYIQTLVDLDLTVIESANRVGITAGASTPNYIIKEVQNSMSELSFEELLKQSEENGNKIRVGSVVEGKVIAVKPEEVIVDIQYKADGIITRNEFSNTPNVDLTTAVQVGDSIKVKVIKTNDGEGQVLLSTKRVAADENYDKLEESFNNNEVLTGKVTQVVDGGLNVVVNECRVFIPASLVSDVYEKDLTKYKDQEVEFVLTEFNPKKRRVIGNRKQLMVARKAELAKKLFDSIKVGDVVEGTVKNVTAFGAFIDLGGADGLLHISEMSWGRVNDPSSVVKVGDVVKTFIKDINGEKIALSMKFEDQNPWVKAETTYAVDNVVTGKVVRFASFGAFVELEPGIDGLLHVSQISNERVEKPEDVLKVGQEITAKVVDFNAADKKISLSMRALLAPAKEEVAEEE